jgi:hypothetical protein
MKTYFLAVLILAASRMSHSAPMPTGAPCLDSEVQTQRSLELQRLRKEDQLDRKWQEDLQRGNQPSYEIMENMSKNDLKRRMRVGEIFGEGCFKSAADYEAAGIVYQHGSTPNHYFQAFVWFKEALDLGGLTLKAEMAMAIDRYLVAIGHKQLFGTQAFQKNVGECFCIQPIERSFPQNLRDEYRGGEDAAYTGLSLLKSLNGPASSCPVAYCRASLRSTPKGTVPGFW